MEEYINSFEKLLQYNAGLLDAIGDCPNIERAVKPHNAFWKSIESKGEYDCQMNVISGKCRVVSSLGKRVANGSRPVMLEKMDRLSSDDFFKPGDIIGISRKGIYEHYAIYIGDGKVIHYCGQGNDFGGTVSVHEADISEFIKDSKRMFVVWFDKGIPYKIQASTSFVFNGSIDWYNERFRENRRNTFSANETIERAKSRIGETKYNLIFNNCEHFAMWCKTGVAESSQVRNILRAAVAAGVCEYGVDSFDAKLLLESPDAVRC